ncbi:MAG: glycosyltransferase family 2 protein [bacterium]|nr:glycosyltransferase family 2 protein [bacterium]
MKIAIIIPAYNEEKCLKASIDAIKVSCPQGDIIVVNDASTDKTKEIALSIPNITLLDLPINLGIGGAMRTGLTYVHRNNYDIAMQVDGDGQHDPVFIPNLLEVLNNDKADMVIGSRFLKREGFTSSPMRILGIRIFSFLIYIVTGKYVSDSTSGFRLYNKQALAYAAKHYPTDFPEPESIVMMFQRGFRLNEIPVIMKERQGGVSSVRPIKAAYFVASNSIAILISAIKHPRV